MKTAVEWLVNQLQQTRDWQRVINEANQSGSAVKDIIKQAKEMENEQIRKSFSDGAQWELYGCDLTHEERSEQYYNETFKSE